MYSYTICNVPDKEFFIKQCKVLKKTYLTSKEVDFLKMLMALKYRFTIWMKRKSKNTIVTISDARWLNLNVPQAHFFNAVHLLKVQVLLYFVITKNRAFVRIPCF